MAANLIYMTKTAWQALLNSIRTKAGISSTLTASEAKDAVDSIVSGIVPITDGAYLFYNGARLSSLTDLKPLLSTINNAQNMFYQAYASGTIDLTFMNVSGCANFSNALAYNSWTTIDVSNWNTSSATNFQNMFRYCGQLREIDLSSFTFSAANAVNTRTMLQSCTQLTKLTLGANCEYLGGNITQASHSMFNGDANLRTLRIKRATPPTLATTDALVSSPGTCTLEHIYVPAASVADYKAATNWAYYEDIISADPEE